MLVVRDLIFCFCRLMLPDSCSSQFFPILVFVDKGWQIIRALIARRTEEMDPSSSLFFSCSLQLLCFMVYADGGLLALGRV